MFEVHHPCGVRIDTKHFCVCNAIGVNIESMLITCNLTETTNTECE